MRLISSTKSSIHMNNVMKNSRLTLKYIVEPDPQKLLRVQKQWKLPNSALLAPEEAEKVFQDPSIHGIIIATPTYMHRDLVIKGLKSGKAVLCEKPIAENLNETRECYEIAKEMQKPLLCAFNRRFDPSFKELQRRVHSGSIGQIHMVKTVARDSPLPSIDYLKISGGIFHDCAVHDIDLICWVIGDYPTHVFASGSAFIPEINAIGDHDTVAFMMKFSSGAISMTDLSRNAVYGYDQRIEVFGPKGMLSAANERPYNLINSTADGESQPPIKYSFPSRYHEGYVAEVEHFCDIIQGLDKTSVTGKNTMNISIIASALEESVKTGRMVEVKY
ncbi:uncharacterized oxidoreductase YrbE-like isoform X2 [Palaemon carinicauda]|uniref:uncharacterized oxidoreductase YrbE-like isoform X2 n=1 Tax=Palaemon carinicauda TaxID=392227 RepID=UPI0035B631EF